MQFKYSTVLPKLPTVLKHSKEIKINAYFFGNEMPAKRTNSSL